MRGKVFIRLIKINVCRITPAYAGKRDLAARTETQPWDHPRLCGEKYAQQSTGLIREGSPPPMRGKAVFPVVVLIDFGITPAYAGKSYRRVSACPVHQDHPRLCGEKLIYNSRKEDCKGSPPPMRGKGKKNESGRFDARITPAYAGKRLYQHGLKCTIQGSPPPMRGKVPEVNPVSSRSRITPAYAGKSTRSPFLSSSCKDHPRLCGEKLVLLLLPVAVLGSPPPMRGKVINPQ